MTQYQLAVLLRALAIEAKLLGKLLSHCVATSPLPPFLGRSCVERAVDDLQKLASRAEALSDLVILG
jgi:hypothetical protein